MTDPSDSDFLKRMQFMRDNGCMTTLTAPDFARLVGMASEQPRIIPMTDISDADFIANLKELCRHYKIGVVGLGSFSQETLAAIPRLIAMVEAAQAAIEQKKDIIAQMNGDLMEAWEILEFAPVLVRSKHISPESFYYTMCSFSERIDNFLKNPPEVVKRKSDFAARNNQSLREDLVKADARIAELEAGQIYVFVGERLPRYVEGLQEPNELLELVNAKHLNAVIANIAELEAALMPFKEHFAYLRMTAPAGIFEDSTQPIYGIDRISGDEPKWAHALTVGDFARARTVLGE